MTLLGPGDVLGRISGGWLIGASCSQNEAPWTRPGPRLSRARLTNMPIKDWSSLLGLGSGFLGAFPLGRQALDLSIPKPESGDALNHQHKSKASSTKLGNYIWFSGLNDCAQDGDFFFTRSRNITI